MTSCRLQICKRYSTAEGGSKRRPLASCATAILNLVSIVRIIVRFSQTLVLPLSFSAAHSSRPVWPNRFEFYLFVLQDARRHEIMKARAHDLSFHVAIAILALTTAGCAVHKSARIEVTPALLWVWTDYKGRSETTNHYAPFVVSQNVPFTMDFAFHDSFNGPDTGRNEPYFDRVMARLTVTLSNDVAFVTGRCDFDRHLGIVASYENDDEWLYA
jgi:hypothetical protein